MRNTIAVYYMLCPRKSESPGAYLQYQRKIADKILNYGFKKQFNLEFSRDKVITGKNGKPYWNGDGDVRFNVSNTDGLVVCGISGGGVSSRYEIGVDAEKPRSIRMPLLCRCCSPEETRYILEGEELSSDKETQKELCGLQARDRFSQIWTLKESYIKMTGEGMSFPLKEAAFSIQKEINGRFHISCKQPGSFVQRKIEGYWIAVCFDSGEENDIVWQELKFS